MRIHATADSIRIVGDEDGFHMIVETDDGDQLDVHVHRVADLLYETVNGTIGVWVDERESARAWQVSAHVNDLDGYDLNDPKRVALEREIH